MSGIKGVESALRLLNSKWKYLILYSLIPGPKRFCELKKSLCGISQKVLVSNLREMEKTGLINRKAFNEQRLKVEYSLTVLGYSVKPVLDYMEDWGLSYSEHKKLIS